MRDTLKYIAVIVASAAVIVFVARLGSCGEKSVGTVAVPDDPNFAPVARGTYQPPSLPFSNTTSGVELPEGMKEKDVARVISLEVRDVAKDPPKRINVIQTKRGDILVHKDSSITGVTVTTFEAQVFAIGMRFGLGLSMGKGADRLSFSPVALFAPIEWLGWLHAPIIAADLDGVGVGAQAQVYHEIFIGVVRLWRFDEGTQAKIVLTYAF